MMCVPRPRSSTARYGAKRLGAFIYGPPASHVYPKNFGEGRQFGKSGPKFPRNNRVKTWDVVASSRDCCLWPVKTSQHHAFVSYTTWYQVSACQVLHPCGIIYFGCLLYSYLDHKRGTNVSVNIRIVLILYLINEFLIFPDSMITDTWIYWIFSLQHSSTTIYQQRSSIYDTLRLRSYEIRMKAEVGICTW